MNGKTNKYPVLISISVLVILLAAGLVSTSCSSTEERSNFEGKTMKLDTVEEVDLERFTGTWYEIARYPHFFEKQLVGVTATYTLRSDGKLRVVNEGYTDSFEGKKKAIKGRARVPDPDNPGWLQVSFFLWFWSDYLILELDTENYQYALIGSSSPNFLWILGRQPEMDEETYEMLVTRARARGYDISKLNKVPQQPEN
ncbi:MAG: lipocalin family protein [Spirochaetales bacterium]|nr:lipocalin family protein [Spirochaetales bacterium]MCF7937344.1 lipocalin family protein [Spirochaetales bacterium]